MRALGPYFLGLYWWLSRRICTNSGERNSGHWCPPCPSWRPVRLTGPCHRWTKSCPRQASNRNWWSPTCWTSTRSRSTRIASGKETRMARSSRQENCRHSRGTTMRSDSFSRRILMTTTETMWVYSSSRLGNVEFIHYTKFWIM